MEGAEAASLLGERGQGRLAQFKTYRRRWFLLAAVCLLNCSNAMVSAARGRHRPVRDPPAARLSPPSPRTLIAAGSRSRRAAGGTPSAWGGWGWRLRAAAAPGSGGGRSSGGARAAPSSRERRRRRRAGRANSPVSCLPVPELWRATPAAAAAAAGGWGAKAHVSQNHLPSLPRSSQAIFRALPQCPVSDPPPHP